MIAIKVEPVIILCLLTAIGRAMIPQYFSSIFDGGATEMYFTFSYPRQYMSHAGPILECDNVLTTTQYLQPSFARVRIVHASLIFMQFLQYRVGSFGGGGRVWC